jgi:predicted Fe-Mo cluster-binding NifX family protein
MKCCGNSKWGGKREQAGRKKTCLKKVPFNRRINENILNILRDYAKRHNLTDTEALESAILLQSNIEKLKGDIVMKICIPTLEGKLCGHFGHCDSFTFAEVNPETKEIISIEKKVPEEGISCQSASWISEQGVSKVLAGGMGGRPMMIFAQNGVEVVIGCPELPILEVIRSYVADTLETGENACGGDGHEHAHCHHHSEAHHCHH